MGEFENTAYNNNEYTPDQWVLVKATMRHRRKWGIRVMRVADEAGRTVYKSRVKQWIYDRDLWSFVIPACGIAVTLFTLAMVMTVIGIMVL